jgi:hypothetical protein
MKGDRLAHNYYTNPLQAYTTNAFSATILILHEVWSMAYQWVGAIDFFAFTCSFFFVPVLGWYSRYKYVVKLELASCPAPEILQAG